MQKRELVLKFGWPNAVTGLGVLGMSSLVASCGVVSVKDICLIDPSRCPSNTGVTTQYEQRESTSPTTPTPTPSPTPTVPLIKFTNGQAAGIVIGQPDFVTVGWNGPTATAFYGPWGDPTVYNGILYITDWEDSRVLGYNSIPASNGAPADFVIGQTNMTSYSTGLTATNLDYPWGASASGGKFAIADHNNERVVIFNSVPTTTNAAADVVLGQPNMTSSSGDGCTQAGLDGPTAVSIGGGKIAVADDAYHRILIWNSVPTSNNANADLVIGQPNFTTCTSNTGGISSQSLYYPGDVWTDGTKLIIADSGNNRILIWNTFPTSNGQAADVVLGQSNFTSGSANQGGAVSGSGVDSGSSDWSNLSSNGRQIFYSDYNNNRILVWNTIPTQSGAAADVVLGQPNFTTKTTPNPPTANSMSGVGGVTYYGTQFMVSDYGNNRVLIFNGN